MCIFAFVLGEGGNGAKAGLQLAVFAGDDVVVHPLPRAGRVSMGRHEDNDVVIDHPSVSRKHAVLHLDDPLRVEDLKSANGTFVRDPRQRVQTGDTQDMRQLSGQTVEITVGDCINVGSVMIVLRYPPRARSLPAPNDDAPPASGEQAFVLRDATMRTLYEQAFRAAQGTISVLLLGENGVGKDVLAQAIHERSARAKRPFVALNCAAVTESLAESELFGHEKGAFTNAMAARHGLFESASGGTVFLDEVGELSPTMQAKLLRVLEDKKVQRVGGRNPIPVDVRFIAATNRDLEQAIAHGAFRQDLFFRLNGMALTIPPLRRRLAEVEPLARVFLESACKQLDRRAVPRLSAEALIALQRYHWPGNVRELRNAIDRAVLLCLGDSIQPEHLPPKMTSPSRPMHAVQPEPQPEPPEPPELPDPEPPEPEPANGAPTRRFSERPVRPGAADEALADLERRKQQLERQRIVEMLEQCAGNQTKAAELLGMSRRTLVTRIAEYNIPRPRKPLP